MALHKDLLDVLVCPGCKGELRPVAGQGAAGPVGLDCGRCGLRFAIVDDIPVMLLDQAERLPASN
jgi:uncharacterized protein YbaR (Trm112 family)